MCSQPSAKRCRHLEFRAGFTLLEMAIVLVIIATIIGGTLSMGSSMVGSARLVNTNNKLDAIETALMAYRTANNRLPCPADPTLTDIPANTTTYGYETGTPGSCTYTNGGYTMPSYTINSNDITNKTIGSWQVVGMTGIEGAVPVKALGLPDEYQFDGWGRKL